MASTPLISIIDDDESLRTALVGLMRSFGYRAESYADAKAFLEAEAGRSACIITDIQMPGLSGIELKQRLSREGVTTPVIMITARTEPGLKDRALASGALCFLEKPFAPEALAACVARALAG